jgi:hypothetical protein
MNINIFDLGGDDVNGKLMMLRRSDKDILNLWKRTIGRLFLIIITIKSRMPKFARNLGQKGN